MKRIVRLTENELIRLVKKVIKEQGIGSEGFIPCLDGFTKVGFYMTKIFPDGSKVEIEIEDGQSLSKYYKKTYKDGTYDIGTWKCWNGELKLNMEEKYGVKGGKHYS